MEVLTEGTTACLAIECEVTPRYRRQEGEGGLGESRCGVLMSHVEFHILI